MLYSQIWPYLGQSYLIFIIHSWRHRNSWSWSWYCPCRRAEMILVRQELLTWKPCIIAILNLYRLSILDLPNDPALYCSFSLLLILFFKSEDRHLKLILSSFRLMSNSWVQPRLLLSIFFLVSCLSIAYLMINCTGWLHAFFSWKELNMFLNELGFEWREVLEIKTITLSAAKCWGEKEKRRKFG